jgi:hypothetical protein
LISQSRGLGDVYKRQLNGISKRKKATPKKSSSKKKTFHKKSLF